jgi:hypothetical protein
MMLSRTWAKTKGAVGVRLMLRDEQISDPADPRLNRAFADAGRHGVPVNFLCWGRLDDGTEGVRRNPDTVVVIDHLGLLQPNGPPPLAEPWADIAGARFLPECAREDQRGLHPFPPALPYDDSGIRCFGSSTRSGSTAACGSPMDAH